MSDHWNSLANLLGTPSLSPQSRKSDKAKGAAETAAKPVSVEVPPNPVEPAPAATDAPQASKSKEPSRLRSSWDAVTSFFGIQSGESAPEAELEKEVTPRDLNRPARARQEPAPKRSKPSLWEDSLEAPAPEPSRRDREPSPPAASEKRSATSESEEPIVSFGEPKRLRKGSSRREPGGRDTARSDDEVKGIERSDSDEKSNVKSAVPAERSPRHQGDRPRQDRGRPDREPAARDRSDRNGPDRERTPRRLETADDVDSIAEAPPRSRGGNRDRSVVSDESTGTPERRSERRPPRRGRSETAATLESEQTAEPIEAVAPASPVRGRDSGRRDRREPDAPPRDGESRPRGRRDSERRDSERREEPAAERSRSRAPAADREGRESGDSSRRRPRSRRDDRAPEEELLRERTPAGFGSGIDDFEHDDAPEVRLDRDESIEGDEVSSEERSPRKRRSRRRGKSDSKGEKASRRDEESTAEEDREAIEAVASHGKIPSWADALGGLVAANMENHARNTHSHGRGRGRGGRPSN